MGVGGGGGDLRCHPLRQVNALEGEHSDHPDSGVENDHRVALKLHHGESCQYYRIERQGSQKHDTEGADVCSTIAEHAPMYDHVHDEVKESTEGCDPA